MPPTNDFVPFCPTDTGTNLLEQAAYLTDAQLAIGNQPGIARLQLVNKALRQATYIAAQVAQFLANATGNNVLDDATPSEVQTTMLKAWRSPPTLQKFLATGSTTGYLFTCSSFNATVGATYTNNGHTYTVLGTVAAGTQLFTSQALAPTASGTLTKATGTGDATITFSANIALATYVPTNANILYLRVRGVGAGAGGAGNGVGSVGGSGGAGSPTVFGPNLITSGFTNSGSSSLGSGPLGILIPPASGGSSFSVQATSLNLPGGMGAATALGTGGNSPPGTNGQTAPANSGGGGGGAASNGASNVTGQGGTCGAFFDCIVFGTTLSGLGNSIPYCVGVGGSAGAGTAGAGAFNGGAGAAGQLEITEYYQ